MKKGKRDERWLIPSPGPSAKTNAWHGTIFGVYVRFCREPSLQPFGFADSNLSMVF